MNNADLYTQANELQRRDAKYLLDEYGRKLKWKIDGDRTIDIGCGDGGVTMDILKKYLPENYERLVGCDISEKMVNFANEHYSDDRTEFVWANIEGDIPKSLLRSFDHVLSFYVLHWIKDQMHAFQNIYDILVEGGDCLVMFLGRMAIFDVYREMAKNNKWAEIMSDVDQYISPFHDSKEPDKEIRKIMSQVGFTNIEVKCVTRSFKYQNLDCMKKAITAVNPFKIPENMREEFLESYISILCKIEPLDKANNNIHNIITDIKEYSLIIAYGTKQIRNNIKI